MSDMKTKISLINKFIGDNLYSIRVKQGISRKQLAEKLNISQQQIEKYEKGKNRISIGLLIVISEVMDTSVNRFIQNGSNDYFSGTDCKSARTNSSMKLFKYYNNIENIELKRAVLNITKTLSKTHLS